MVDRKEYMKMYLKKYNKEHKLELSSYKKEYREKHKAERQQYRREYYIKNKNGNEKNCQNRRYFGGNRDKALIRDNNICQDCNTPQAELDETLNVHHIDGQGRGCKIKNNKLDNLITLCKSCHTNRHRQELLNLKE